MSPDWNPAFLTPSPLGESTSPVTWPFCIRGEKPMSRRRLSAVGLSRPAADTTSAGANPSPSDGEGSPSLDARSEEHTSELQSLMRISYAVFCLTKKTNNDKKLKNNTLHKRKTKQ